VENRPVRASGQTTGPKAPARPQKKTKGKPPAKPRPAGEQATAARPDTAPGLVPLLEGLLALIEAHRASATEGPAAVVLLVLGKIADLAQRFATAPELWRLADFATRDVPGEDAFAGLALSAMDKKAPEPPPAAKPQADAAPPAPRASRAPDVVAPAPLGALHRLLATWPATSRP